MLRGFLEQDNCILITKVDWEIVNLKYCFTCQRSCLTWRYVIWVIIIIILIFFRWCTVTHSVTYQEECQYLEIRKSVCYHMLWTTHILCKPHCDVFVTKLPRAGTQGTSWAGLWHLSTMWTLRHWPSPPWLCHTVTSNECRNYCNGNSGNELNIHCVNCIW